MFCAREKILISAVILVAGISASNARASGYLCQAQCIATDPANQILKFLGRGEVAADLLRNQVFDGLIANCRQLAHAQGIYDLQALPVKAISFSSDYSHDEWHSLNEVSASSSLRTAVFGIRSAYFTSEYVNSFVLRQYDQVVDKRHLAAQMTFASAADCKAVKTIPAGTDLPYLGDEKVFP